MRTPPLPDFLRPLIISGPSGTGKGTLLTRLFEEHPDKFGFTVSHTTRSPRPGEVDGEHYHFVSHETFKSLLDQGAFIEHAQFSGNFYGTSFKTVNQVASSGRRCLMDIDCQGVRQIKQMDNLNPIFLFLSPPSLDTLRKRLEKRGTETPASMTSRLEAARREIDYAKTPNVYDIIIVNEDFDKSYEIFERVALGNSDPVDTLPAFD